MAYFLVGRDSMENFINRLDSVGTSGVGVNELVNVLGKFFTKKMIFII